MLERYGIPLQMSEPDFFLLCLSTVMIAAAGYIINDYFDIKIDRINCPKRIVVGKYIKRRVAMGAHIVINTLGVLLAFWVAYKNNMWYLGFIQVFTATALWNYSVTFQRRFLIGNIIVSLMTALVPLIVGLYELLLLKSNFELIIDQVIHFIAVDWLNQMALEYYDATIKELANWISAYSFFAFLTTLIREIIKDIEDIEGDKAYNCKTMPIVLGQFKAGIVAAFLTFLLMVIITFFQLYFFNLHDLKSVMFIFIAIQIPLIIIIYALLFSKNVNRFKFSGDVMKLVMLSGISFILFNYFIHFV
jgi:4-hydroxybenzoate polyprenyltransferase